MFTVDTDFDALSCLESLEDLDIEAEMDLIGDLEPLPLSPFDLADPYSFSPLPAPAIPLDFPEPPAAEVAAPIAAAVASPTAVERVVEITPRKKRKRESCSGLATPPPRVRSRPSAGSAHSSPSSVTSENSSSSSSVSSVRMDIDHENGLLQRIHNPSRMWCARHCSPTDDVRVCDDGECPPGYRLYVFK